MKILSLLSILLAGLLYSNIVAQTEPMATSGEEEEEEMMAEKQMVPSGKTSKAIGVASQTTGM